MMYQLSIGLKDKDTKQQAIETVEAVKVAQNIARGYTGGGSVFAGQGFYTHESGELVQENTIKIELIGVELSTVKELATALKMAFNQESILLVSLQAQADFI